MADERKIVTVTAAVVRVAGIALCLCPPSRFGYLSSSSLWAINLNAMRVLSFYSLAFLASTLAVEVQHPIKDQLPLVARVGKQYSWSFSPSTFASQNVSVEYTTEPLPSWLKFDSKSITFWGTPAEEDTGHPEVTVTAADGSSSASSTFTICVTPKPAPMIIKDVASQFHQSNPSLSSVFLLQPNSAISSQNPGLRIPPQWSFSIGFDSDTFSSQESLHYDARLEDGSPLPDWMKFNPTAMTFNGYTPKEQTALTIALHASDQEGYSGASQLFDVVISPHELTLASTSSSLPTINITSATSFNFSLNSPSDFAGIVVDGKPLTPAQIANLNLDVSSYSSWLRFDSTTRTLSGEPPADFSSATLPATITSDFNQTLDTNVSLAAVPSFFSTVTLPPMSTSRGEEVDFALSPFFSNATSGETSQDVNLTASFDPSAVQSGLSFDQANAKLEGAIPKDISSSHISVTFTAYSRVTHSTSHTTLAISLPHDGSSEADHGGISGPARSKLILALEIVFGIIGGVVLLGILLALFRKYAHVEDTALTGEEGRVAWTEKDRKWYGMDGKHAGLGSPTSLNQKYGHIGLGLRTTASGSDSNKLQSPGVMSKKDFFANMKDSVRKISGRYSRPRKFSPRPTIGKPIIRYPESESISPSVKSNLPGITSIPGSSVMTGSPTGSSNEQSIAVQHAFFSPPHSPAQVHFIDNPLNRQPLSRQASSASSESLHSIRTHAEEAIVQHATKTSSIRSAKTASMASCASEMIRPRLVPFTHASPVPLPKLPSGSSSPSSMGKTRVPSHRAQLCKTDDQDSPSAVASGDDLGYLRSLGVEDLVTPSLSTNARSSFSSLESSPQRQSKSLAGPPPEKKVIVSAGQRFKERIPLHAQAATVGKSLEVKLTDGEPVPNFIKYDCHDIAKAYGGVVIWGTTRDEHLGLWNVGVFANGDCIAVFELEIVKHRIG